VNENRDHAGGHGRAFQLLAAELDTAAERLLGLRLRIGGCLTYQCNWEEVRHLPSKHDVECWRWEGDLEGLRRYYQYSVTRGKWVTRL
jgi:hypothetical protein